MNAKVEQGKLSRALLQSKQNRSAGVLANPPAVTITKQIYLPDDLRIPVAATREPLDYTIPQPSEPEEEDDAIEFRIRVKGDAAWTELESLLELGEIARRVWPLQRSIATDFLVELATPEPPTEYEVQYIYWYGGVNEGYSDIRTFAIDLTPPYKVKHPAANLSPGAPAFPDDIGPGQVIDEVVLDRHSDGMPIRAAAYGSYLPTDYIRVYWGLAPDVDRDAPVFEGLLPSELDVLIPIDKFASSAEGPNTLRYTVTDLVGNRSRVSNPTVRTVRFIGDPTTVLPPVVPLADGTGGDDRIDLADCRTGVQIIVTVPTPNAPGDTITAYWGTEELDEKRVDTNTSLTWDVDYDVIKKVYGVTDGDVVTNISYKMFRGAEKIAESDIDINVDIAYPGPTNPNEPDPVNVALNAPRLVSANGNDDEILDEDYGENATIHIDLYDAPPTEEGLFIEVYYDDELVGDPIPLTAGQEGTTIEVILPWKTIADHNNGTKVLRWVLYSSVSPNPVGAPPKDILVNANRIETPAPEVLNLAGPARLRIGCSTLNFGASNDGTSRRNLLVRVLKSPYTVEGAIIELSWSAVTIPTDGSEPQPLPGETSKPQEIVGTFPDDGVVIEIGDYNDNFRPTNRGRGTLTYTIRSPGSGTTPPSLPATHDILLTNGEGQYCEEVIP